MDLVFKYFPFICLIVVGVNALIFRARAERLAGSDEIAQEEYGALIRGFVIYAGGWFLAQGIGVVTGEVSAMGIEPHPGRGVTTYDWVLFAGIIFVNLRFVFWVFREDGAAFLSRRGRIFNAFPTSPAGVKFLALAAAAAGLLGASWRMWAATRGGV